MGKKKKSFYKKQIKPLVKGNKLLLAALSGLAAGVTLSTILGTDKAKEIIHTVEDSIQNFTAKISDDAKRKVPSFGRSKNQETIPSA